MPPRSRARFVLKASYALCLIGFAAVVTLWIRSYFICDHVAYHVAEPRTRHAREWNYFSNRGTVRIICVMRSFDTSMGFDDHVRRGPHESRLRRLVRATRPTMPGEVSYFKLLGFSADANRQNFRMMTLVPSNRHVPYSLPAMLFAAPLLHRLWRLLPQGDRTDR